LGLAIVKRLIDRAGGQLLISSTPGIGSEFRVIFPC
jgi:signal transduction histidine kinase